MFGISSWELVVVVLAALILIGPQKLPELLRQLRDLSLKMRELSTGVRNAMNEVARAAQIDDLKKEKRQIDALLDCEEHDKSHIG